MSYRRSKLAPSGHQIAFFADTPGGVFNESFPSVHPFPARALLVPLQGQLAIDVYGDGKSIHAEPRAATGAVRNSDGSPWGGGKAVTTRTVLTTLVDGPVWDDHHADADERMVPRSEPLEIPFGQPHAVRTVGDHSACWAYVFGERPAAPQGRGHGARS